MFTKTKLNQVFSDLGYRHLDITVQNLKKRRTTRAVRFKLFNDDGRTGLEFRRLSDWPKVFKTWPGKDIDIHGEFYRIVSSNPRSLNDLDPQDLQVIADLIEALPSVVENAAEMGVNLRLYLSDANVLVTSLQAELTSLVDQNVTLSDALAEEVAVSTNNDKQASHAVTVLRKARPKSAFILKEPTVSESAQSAGVPLHREARLREIRQHAVVARSTSAYDPGRRIKVIVNAASYVGQSSGAGGAGIFLQYLVSKLSEVCSVDVLVTAGTRHFESIATSARFFEVPHVSHDMIMHLRNGPTVVIDPFGGLPCLPFPDDVGLCIVIHDLMHLQKPHFFTESERTGRSRSFADGIARADAVIAFSKDQGSAIQKFYPGTKVDVIPHLPYAALRDRTAEDYDLGTIQPFVLFPAVKWPHKNHKTVISAFNAYICKTGSRLKLVLCGGSCSESRFSFLPSADLLSKNIVDIGHVSESLLQDLFEKAEAVLFPTLYEGFGIPVLEAAVLGKMVVASRLAVFDEILGPTGYFSVEDSLCEMRWVEAFAAIESSLRHDFEARSAALKSNVNPASFLQSFNSVLATAAGRYVDPSLYPLRHFQTGDRITSRYIGVLSFTDIYGHSQHESGARYPTIGDQIATRTSSIFKCNDADHKVCLRAEIPAHLEMDPGLPLVFSAWLRLKSISDLEAIRFSANDKDVQNLLPRLQDNQWHLFRRQVPAGSFIDFRASRDGANEVSGFELEIHDASLLQLPPMPAPEPDTAEPSLTLVVESIKVAVDLLALLGAIQSIEAGAPNAAARLQWIVLLPDLAVDIKLAAALPANVRVLTVDANSFDRDQAARLISPYQPVDKLLLLGAEDLAECQSEENLHTTGRPSALPASPTRRGWL